MIESCSVAGPGFVNIVLSKNWMAKVKIFRLFVVFKFSFLLSFLLTVFLAPCHKFINILFLPTEY